MTNETTTAEAGQGPTAASRLWSIGDCARFLQKSPRWLAYATKAPPEQVGSIPFVRIGRNVRFFPEDVKNWVRLNCPPAATFNSWRLTEDKKQKKFSDTFKA